MAVIQCRHFSGYKPCEKNNNCHLECSHKDLISKSILIIHLGAMGSVVRSSALLRKLKQDNQGIFIVWLTSETIIPILKNHPAIDQLYGLNFINFIKLQGMEFDEVLVIDKSLEAISIAQQLKTKKIKGFKAMRGTGAVLPADEDARELWEIGLSNNKKFFQNKKTELQLIFESLGFFYNQEKYWVHLNASEELAAENRKRQWLSKNHKRIIVGINTGCSQVIAYKKLSVNKLKELIWEIISIYPDVQIVLLGGGQEDEDRNNYLASQFSELIATATQIGLRDGMISVKACDVVISGDSLGMHLAIAFDKFTIAWFGPTCAHEVDLFGNGVYVKTSVNCSPCWKRSCSNEKMCYDHVDINDFIMAIDKGMKKLESNHAPSSHKENSHPAHGISW